MQPTDDALNWLNGSDWLSWLPAAAAQVDRLTVQQRAVLSCLAAGMDNRTAAQAMRRSEATIRLHTGEIMRRLQVTSRLQAGIVAFYVMAVEHQILPDQATNDRYTPSATSRCGGGAAAQSGRRTVHRKVTPMSQAPGNGAQTTDQRHRRGQLPDTSSSQAFRQPGALLRRA